MASPTASPGPTARIRLGALLVLLPLAAGCGSGGGPGAVSDEARLASLSVTGGELVPAFSPDVHTYSLDVGGLAAGIVVSPTALGSGTAIRVQGDEVPSADESDPVLIPPGGVQAILVETTASDGVATSSYTILVIRALLESATLEGYLKKHAHVTDALGLRYDADHHFGYAVALSGDTLVVGAPLESGSGAGVDPPVGGVSVASGAAYVFVRTAGAWAQQAYLKSPQPARGDEFGFSVAISGDLILVGAPYADSSKGPDAGAATLFSRSGGSWAVAPSSGPIGPIDPGDHYGWSVAVSTNASGTTIVVGAPGEDSGKPTDASDNSAESAGIAWIEFGRGDLAASIYVKASNAQAGDLFGQAVAVSGDTLVVGAPGESSAAGFSNRNPLDNAAIFAGAAYVYGFRSNPTRPRMFRLGSPGSWVLDAYLKAPVPDPFDLFGASVSVSGRRVVVGAPGEDGGFGTSAALLTDNSALDAGAAFLFTRTGVTWGGPQILKADQPTAGDHFGTSVSVSGLIVAVGAPDEDGSGVGVAPPVDELRPGSGAAHVFVIGPPWLSPLYVKAHVPDPGDAFGTSVAVSGDTLVVGAIDEQSIALGVNGDATDDTGPALGAAYVYR